MFGDIQHLHTQEPNITPPQNRIDKSKPCINGKIETGFSTHEEDQSVIDAAQSENNWDLLSTTLSSINTN